MDLLEYGMCLQEEILQLISLQQEGGYWDFKRQWYTNKTDISAFCNATGLSSLEAMNMKVNANESEQNELIQKYGVVIYSSEL